MTNRDTSDSNSADTRLAWTIGGALLLVSPVLSLGTPPIGSFIPGGGYFGPVCFSAATVLFAFGIRGSGSVTARRPLGTTALVFLGVWTMLTATLLGGPVMSTIYAATGGNEWTLAIGNATVLIQSLGALIAAIEIGRAGVVPRPWNWAPTWALAAIAVPWAILRIVGLVGEPAVMMLVFAFSTIDGIINITAAVFLGVVAIVLAQLTTPTGTTLSDDLGGEETGRAGTDPGRRNRSVLLLLVVGALVTIGGVVGGLLARASIDRALSAASGVPTLPVFTYTQYTQAHPFLPDLTGLWIGSFVAVLGVAILLAGVVVATMKPRAMS
ncbi:hypothetical protein [Leifsonia sp. NPDC058248]|uniref:hypothetical protein n=1 Tax=Leifsonia sp. NPDC058248 TaxID=3346402 RepID=UPI0036DBAECD